MYTPFLGGGGMCLCGSSYKVCEAAGVHGMCLCVEVRGQASVLALQVHVSHLAFPPAFWRSNSGLRGYVANTY